MAFPLSWRSSFTVPAPEAAPITAEEILGAIGHELRHAHLPRVKLVAERITYGGAWIRPVLDRWNVFARFDRGTVSVRRVSDGFDVEYEVSLRRLLWTDFILIAAVFAILMVERGRVLLGDLLPLFLFAWLAAYALGAFFSLVSYSEFLRRVVSIRIDAAETNHAQSSQAAGA